MGRNTDSAKNAAPGHKQAAVAEHYKAMGYSSDPLMIMAGLTEELGEIAREVLLDCPLYKARPDKLQGDIEHEMFDVLVYLCALANAYGIDLGI